MTSSPKDIVSLIKQKIQNRHKKCTCEKFLEGFIYYKYKKWKIHGRSTKTNVTTMGKTMLETTKMLIQIHEKVLTFAKHGE